MNRIVTRLIMLGMVLVLSACAGNMKTLPDGQVLAMATVGDSLDRSASYTGKYRVVGKNADGSPIYEEVAGDLTVGPTVGGQVLVSTVGGVATAATNGLFAKDIARIGKCDSEAGCNNGGNINLQVQGAQALAESNSGSASGVTVTEMTTSGRCVSCEAFAGS